MKIAAEFSFSGPASLGCSSFFWPQRLIATPQLKKYIKYFHILLFPQESTLFANSICLFKICFEKPRCLLFQHTRAGGLYFNSPISLSAHLQGALLHPQGWEVVMECQALPVTPCLKLCHSHGELCVQVTGFFLNSVNSWDSFLNIEQFLKIILKWKLFHIHFKHDE